MFNSKLKLRLDALDGMVAAQQRQIETLREAQDDLWSRLFIMRNPFRFDLKESVQFDLISGACIVSKQWVSKDLDKMYEVITPDGQKYTAREGYLTHFKVPATTITKTIQKKKTTRR